MSLASERRWGVLAALRAQFDLKAARTTSELGRMKAGHLFQMPGLLSVLTDSGLDMGTAHRSRIIIVSVTIFRDVSLRLL